MPPALLHLLLCPLNSLPSRIHSERLRLLLDLLLPSEKLLHCFAMPFSPWRILPSSLGISDLLVLSFGVPSLSWRKATWKNPSIGFTKPLVLSSLDKAVYDSIAVLVPSISAWILRWREAYLNHLSPNLLPVQVQGFI